jgi:pectinesterase
MRFSLLRLVSLIVLATGTLSLMTFAGDPTRLVVAQDGSGTHRTIQAAIDAVPNGAPETAVILVRNGTYREKLFITKSRIAIVGEDRDSTRIIYPELRRNWRAANGDNDWGCAVVNIGGTATDVTLTHLTIYNNYGALTGDHDHQFALFLTERATNLALIECTVMADGGDTVSPWNSVDGRYYFNGCRFVGWVDFVCPRGWCYITDSEFYGFNLSAALWHDGSAAQDQKFVITRSRFDGVPGFPLGRHHRDGQFYLLDCWFSRNMDDKPIHNPTYSPNSQPWVWGDRHYFHGCDREGEDFAWFADNLASAPGSPRPESVTAPWTFGGTWDPVASLPSVTARAVVPTPEDHSASVSSRGIELRWIGGRNAVGHVVRLGLKGAPPVAGTSDVARFATGPLEPNSTYYWAVDTVTPTDTVKGAVWQFRTGPHQN